MREDAALVGAALATEGGADVDVDAAWRRLSTAAPAHRARRRAPAPAPCRPVPRGPAPSRSSRPLAVAVVLAGAGTAAANDWLQIFRTEQVAPVSLSTADLVALPDLSAYGDARGDRRRRRARGRRRGGRGGGDRSRRAGGRPTLPRGVSGEPVYQVGGEVSATFTFSAERAAQAAAEAGETLPPPPPGLDGSQVRLVAGPGVAQIWSSAAGVPALVVGRAVAPTAFSSGVPFETVRDYLLSLPGLPDDVAAQLRTFTADGSTLPLPVPADQVTTSSAQVDGVPATVLATRDRTLAAVVWVDDGVVTAVAGSLDADEVLSVARELR